MEEDRQAGRGKEAEQAAMYDGMEILTTPPAKLRFGRDLRLLEVRVAAPPPPPPPHTHKYTLPSRVTLCYYILHA